MSGRHLALYGNDQLPVVVVLEGGDEVTGDLCAWEQLDDDSWRGHVVHRRPEGLRIAWFPAASISEVTTGPWRRG